MQTHVFHNISGVHEFIIERESVCIIYIFLTQIDTHQLSITTRCLGSGASVDVRIIHIQKHNETLSLSTIQHHDAPHTKSTVLVKGVLYDHAQLKYNGKIYVSEQAEHTHADQKSHTLLLSAMANAQATPSLEVLTKEVQCKHGSAVAALNATQVEYLASRGIAYHCAQKILVESFFLSALDDQNARDYFIKYLS